MSPRERPIRARRLCPPTLMVFPWTPLSFSTRQKLSTLEAHLFAQVDLAIGCSTLIDGLLEFRFKPGGGGGLLLPTALQSDSKLRC